METSKHVKSENKNDLNKYQTRQNVSKWHTLKQTLSLVHKKDSKQLKTQYRPISPLPICSKIFEKIILDQMYEFLNSNNLISQNQSGFRPGDSTINQLLSITTEIYEAF